MWLFKRDKFDPDAVILKIVESFPEEQLIILNSCESCDFHLCLLKFCFRKEHKFKFKSWEEATPIIKRMIEIAKKNLIRNPIQEFELEQYCSFVIDSFFDEIKPTTKTF